MRVSVRVLYCGDSEVQVVTTYKGFDSFSFSYASDESHYLRDALGADGEIECSHLDVGRALAEYPTELRTLSQYDVLILSDVGHNTLALTPGFVPPMRVPMSENRVSAIADFVKHGGGLLMIGGWMSFSGIYGKAAYAGSLIEEVLPVRCQRSPVDDRVEVVEGFMPHVDTDHALLRGLPWNSEFVLLGYNRVEAKPDSAVLARRGSDPLLALAEVGDGRSAVFTSDVAPHWAGTFVEWQGYGAFWCRLVKWLARRSQT